MVFLLRIFAFLFSALPHGWALRLGGVLGWVFGHVVRYHRRDAIAALSRSFPEKTPPEIRDIVNGMYRHLGLNGAEFLRVLGGKADEVGRLVEVRGAEHIEEALARGKGALALVSHLGNWEFLALAMAHRFQPSGMIIKELRQDALSDYLIRKRTELNLIIWPRRGAYRACFKALRENTLIGFVLDQNMMWKEGVFVEFFGRPACTSPGLAHLAAQAGAPVVPIFIARQAGGRHILIAQALLEPPGSRDPEEILAATQTYTRLIEDAIRAHPEQWIWIHRRWRTTPEKVQQAKKMKAPSAPEQSGLS